DVLICDELGYLSFSRAGAELLFQVFAERYERKSLLVTSNLPFGDWVQVFQGERMTAALLDRLTHRCHIFEMNGESYRFRESMKEKRPRETKRPGPGPGGVSRGGRGGPPLPVAALRVAPLRRARHGCGCGSHAAGNRFRNPGWARFRQGCGPVLDEDYHMMAALTNWSASRGSAVTRWRYPSATPRTGKPSSCRRTAPLAVRQFRCR